MEGALIEELTRSIRHSPPTLTAGPERPHGPRSRQAAEPADALAFRTAASSRTSSSEPRFHRPRVARSLGGGATGTVRRPDPEASRRARLVSLGSVFLREQLFSKSVRSD